MLGFFPVMGIGEQLEETFPSGDGNHQPVEWHDDADFRQMPRSATHAGN